jgi:4-amino-4-deoxy-L-arabinose transferase-like glycosyltransferase
MLLEQILSAQAFEALMMVCFGVSWPVAIYKTLRTRRTEGKSLLFLLLILLGYVAGIAAKFIVAAQSHTKPNWVTLLYAANAIMVAVDIFLYQRYRPRRADPDLSEPTLP